MRELAAVILLFVTTLVCACGWMSAAQTMKRDRAAYAEFQDRVITHLPVRYLDHIEMAEFE